VIGSKLSPYVRLRLVLWRCALAAAAVAAAGETIQERLGHPATAKLLVIHADDLGMAHSVDVASFEALQRGWITSASALVPTPWFPEVARFARAHPEADLGIHLALTSEWPDYRWGPLAGASTVPSLVDADGYLQPVEGIVAQKADVAEVERELRAQIERARASGLAFSHLDSHMGALYKTPQLLEVYRRMGSVYDVPLRLEREPARASAGATENADPMIALIDRILWMDSGVPLANWPSAYETMLTGLPPGVYELIVHLGHDDEELRTVTGHRLDWGSAWRQADLDLVRSRRFRRFLDRQGFVLVSWRDLARARRSAP
jgi:predicted glycoside hydrolase/deacetylase ChbG (UPF0249 family)